MVYLKKDLLAKRKGGRPRVYDTDKIIEELLIWKEKKDSINFAQFCANHANFLEAI